MILDMRMPVWVESKYQIGNRVTCVITFFRISVIAR